MKFVNSLNSCYLVLLQNLDLHTVPICSMWKKLMFFNLGFLMISGRIEVNQFAEH